MSTTSHLLVSKELEGIIDEEQFFGESVQEDIVAPPQDVPFYVVLSAGDAEFVGSLVQLEEELHGAPAKHKPAKSITVRLICRAKDVGELVKNRHELESFSVCDTESTKIATYDVSQKKVIKFGITQDNPLDTTVYAVYIRFG